jgi:hypothetical protein
LREVLNSVPSWGKLIIEVKSGVETIPFIKQEVEASILHAQQLEFIGFELATMFQTKRGTSAKQGALAARPGLLLVHQDV